MRKMVRITLSATAVLVIAATAPAVSAAASKSFTLKQSSGTLTGTSAKGKISGGTFGKGTLKGTVTPPTGKYTVKVKGGTIKFTFNATKIDGVKVAGSIKLTGGTGKFKGIKGKGTFAGDQVTGKFVYKAKYTL